MKFVWPAHLMPRAALWVALAVMAGVGVGAAVTYWLTGSPSAEQAALKIRYYKNPMGTGHVSGKPMKDEMGMDYVAVYEEEVKGTLSSEPDSIAVDPRVVQNIGVRTAVVEKGRVAGEISANGVLALDEARTAIVTTKVDGYLETLHVRAIGQMVKPDDPLFDFYSPDLSAAMEEYLAAQRYQDTLPAGANQTMHRNATHLAIAAQKRLEALGLNAAHIRKIQSEGAVPRVVTFYSTQSGVVIKKNAVQGSRVAAGTELFVLADLSELWVLADVYSQDYAALRVGSRARVEVQGLPEKIFEGRVDFIYPTVDAQTRVAKVRIVLPNPKRLLRPDMFAQVKIQGPAQTQLMLPKSAVLRSGTRDWVILALGEGRFRPQAIKLGGESGEHYAVLSGVKEGEVVVSSAQFLIDSESRLQAALHKLASESTEK